MRPQSVAWERAAEVREVARGWRRAGAIDEATEGRIRDAFPDPGVTPSAPWRVLTAGMVTAILLCTLGAFWLAFRPDAAGSQALLLLFAGAALVATELCEAAPRLARRGAAGATAFWAVALFLGGVGLVLSESARLRLDDALDWILATGVVAWGAACWRWGSPLFAGLSAVSLFGLLARFPLGRVLWIALGAALTALAAQRLDHAPWAPSHRRAATALLVAGIAAVYAAVNVYSLDQHLIENLRRTGASGVEPFRGIVILAVLATILVPLAVLGWGLWSRRTLLLDVGIVLVALSLVTLRHYVHLAPLWTVLVVGGAALVGLVIAAERALRRAPGGEIAGFTADPLFSDELGQHALQVVPVVASFTPAGAGPADRGKDFAGGGGAFGGGGASDRF